MAKQKQHRSMRGKLVDMNLLQKKNELTPAIGNARMNARGDIIGKGGKIVKKREDIVKEHYAQEGVVRDVSGRPRVKQQESTEEQKLEAAAVIEEDLSEEELELFEEAAEDDEWIEDEDGNFIKKEK